MCDTRFPVVAFPYIGVTEPEKRKKEVVQSGRLVDFKNQPMLLQAFIEVHKKHPDYVLKIYGGDSFDGTKEILESIIQKNEAAVPSLRYIYHGSDLI